MLSVEETLPLAVALTGTLTLFPFAPELKPWFSLDLKPTRVQTRLYQGLS